MVRKSRDVGFSMSLEPVVGEAGSAAKTQRQLGRPKELWDLRLPLPQLLLCWLQGQL